MHTRNQRTARLLGVFAAALFFAMGCGDSDNGDGAAVTGGGGGGGEVSDSLREAFDEAFCRMQCTDQIVCEGETSFTMEQCMGACPNPAGVPPHETFGRNNAACMNAGIAYFTCEVEEGCDAQERHACDDEQRAYSQGCP